MFIETVKIGERDVQLCCCASIMPCFKNVFGEDFLKAVTNDPEDVELFMKMGFIMAQFAELKDRNAVSHLTQDDFGDWLDQFPMASLIKATGKIAQIIMKESGGSVPSKKNKGAQSDR